MPEQDDVTVAFHALQQGDITGEQLLDSLYAMAEDRAAGQPGRALGTILVGRKYLTQSRLRDILGATAMPGIIPEEATRGDSIKLGQLLAMSGVVSYDQVLEALLQQEVGREQGQPRMRLGEYLVSMGYTTPQAIQRALSYQRKAVYRCKKCQARFNIVNAQPNRLYQCVRCQGELVHETENVRVDESAVVEAMAESSHPPPPMTPLPMDPENLSMERIQTDRAVAKYLVDNRVLPADVVYLAQAWQLEIAGFGVHAPLLEILRRTRRLPDERVRALRQTDFSKLAEARPVIPGYRLTGRVTQGPTTSIYLAQPQFTSGPVGLKLLHAEFSTSEANVARFKQDATLCIRFDHPGIVKAYEYASVPLMAGSGRTVHYATMEFVRGKTLDHLILINGKQPPSRAVALALDIAAALRHLEKEGFVHGALRPENVLVDERHRARLIDLGSAAPIDRSAAADPRIANDIFALGTLLRAMLSGGLVPVEKPGQEFGSVRLSADLMNALRAMLHPDPRQRFQHYGDAAAVLQALAERTTA